MGTERGARTTLVFGGVAVEVALTKTSAKPSDAKYETRRMIGELPADDARQAALREFAERNEIKLAAERRFPSADATIITPAEDHALVVDFKTDEDRDEPIPADVRERQERTYRQALDIPDPFAGLEPERIEHGVTLDDGTFVDLSEQLAQIDERTRIEGMEVLATISSASVPRVRVRDSHWIGLAPGAEGGAKVLALLWRALREANMLAVVRWTKRTNQALGVILPVGSLNENTAALGLLEIEWSANMRQPAPRATMPIRASVSVREAAAALALVEALHASPGVLDTLVDERLTKRAELLTAAREGRLDSFEAPAERPVVEPVEDVADALTAAAQR